MRFVRFGPIGNERPGLLTEEGILDLTSLIADIDRSTVGSLQELTRRAKSNNALPSVAADEIRLGPPIDRPGKIVGIGLNYADHASEAGMEIPSEPIVFAKATTSLCGPFDDLILPPEAESVDFEVELALVIGHTCRYLGSESEASAAIAGYVVANDISERSWQLQRGGQWIKGKSFDTFCPIGPWLVTAEDVANPLDLQLGCIVNGQTRQQGSTSTMIFGPYHLVWYLSQIMTLEPGDLILTGTPPGVGLGTGNYLTEGDVVESWVEGLGRQSRTCVPL